LPRLDGFLKKLPSGFKFALEIHNKTRLTPQFQQLLRSHEVTLALIDYSVDAPAETLFRTACEKITHRGLEVFVYINNHYAGHTPASVHEFLRRWRETIFRRRGQQSAETAAVQETK
jgi:uncharacterized protein YecE (DUF72 family)